MSIRFETLIERHHDELFHYLWRMLRGTTLDPADIAQDTWLRAWQAYDRLRPGSNPRAWLYRIATNSALKALRRARPEVPIDEDRAEPSDALTPEELLDDAIALDLALKRVAALPPRQRAAVLLRYGQELRYDEMAVAMQCSEESARANVSLGIRRLRRELEEA